MNTKTTSKSVKYVIFSSGVESKNRFEIAHFVFSEIAKMSKTLKRFLTMALTEINFFICVFVINIKLSLKRRIGRTAS